MINHRTLTSRPLVHFVTLATLTVSLSLLVQSSKVSAQTALPEQIITVKKPGFLGADLETTFYKPPGDGPFPLVVINHGKAAGDPRFQGRYMNAGATRYFLQRGYVVVYPMRQGFSKSTGGYIGGGCNVESNGVVQAEDVKAVIDYFAALPYVDKQKIIIAGQSHGGLTTMAFGTLNYPGVQGLINFAGGLRQDTCAGWESVLARAFGSYGKSTKTPSLWFYGDNDSYWPKPVWESMFSQYEANAKANGAITKMVAFGPFVVDAHSMFGHRQGFGIWQPEVGNFLQSLGMPYEVSYAQFGQAPLSVKPAATIFAAINDIGAVPHLKDSGRKGYETFLTQPMPRAFALSPTGAWGSNQGLDDSHERALASCNRFSPGQPCKLYAVDDIVVW